MVGRSLASGVRLALVTPSARTFPSRISGSKIVIASNVTCTFPPSSAVTASPPLSRGAEDNKDSPVSPALVAKLYPLYYKLDTLLETTTLLPQRGSIYSEEGSRHAINLKVGSDQLRDIPHLRQELIEIAEASGLAVSPNDGR